MDAPPDAAPDRTIDITHEVCPMTMVRTRLALDALPAGRLLAVRLRGAAPRRSVAATTAALGHAVIGTANEAGGVTTLLIRKGGGAPPA